jgi:hypothetical protein
MPKAEVEAARVRDYIVNNRPELLGNPEGFYVFVADYLHDSCIDDLGVAQGAVDRLRGMRELSGIPEGVFEDLVVVLDPAECGGVGLQKKEGVDVKGGTGPEDPCDAGDRCPACNPDGWWKE